MGRNTYRVGDDHGCAATRAIGEVLQIGRVHATVEAMSALLLAEFEPEALSKMSIGAQLQLTRTLVRNLVDRLEFANSRVTK